PCKNPDWDGENPDPATSNAPYRVYNIGNNKPVELLRFVAILEEYLGKKAVKKMLPMQPGDVPVTYANVDELIKDVGFKPATPIETGLKKFTDWYKWYFNVR
ncbi:MAG: capsular biosynthesis protein CpsI, partial [Candidatus Kuenenia stuttgartiensis]|nr:capsular biosynthesis protein CpsI [Candidatus Kuenenia stuttgartiensis]